MRVWNESSGARGVVMTHRNAEDEPVVVLSGRLRIDSVGRFRDAVMQACAQTKGVVRIDMSRVPAVEPAGLRTLIACRRLATASGVNLLVVQPSQPVAAWFRRTGLTRVFNLEPDADALPSDVAVGSSERLTARAMSGSARRS